MVDETTGTAVPEGSPAHPPATAPVHIPLASRRQGLVAALGTAGLLISGLDAIESGSTSLGALSVGAGLVGVRAVIDAGRRPAFLRWSNAVNALMFATVAVQKFARGKVALPTLQVVVALALLACAAFDLPKRRSAIWADGTGLEVRWSRLRVERLAWTQVRELRCEGARLCIECASSRRIIAVAAAPIAAATQAQLAALHGAARAAATIG